MLTRVRKTRARARPPQAAFPEGAQSVRGEVVQFHVTGPAFNALKKYVKAHSAGCTVHRRALTPAQKAASADKHTKRTTHFVDFTVTRAAQLAHRAALERKKA